MASAQRAMAQRRKKDAEIETYMRNNQMNMEAHLRATWEVKTDAKLLARRKEARIAQFRAQQSERLMERRRQLAQLLNGEMAKWQQEISTSTETSEDRKNSLRERAMRLRDAREAERRSFVEQKYSLQWRDSCDDARTLDSKALRQLVTTTRQQQLQEKANKARDAETEEQRYLAVWRERISEVERKETAKEERRRQMDSEVKGILDQQVELHDQRKAQLRAAQAEEARIELSEWARAKEAEEQEALEKLKEAYNRGRVTREFNQARLGINTAKQEQEKAEDLMLLRYWMDKEKADEENEKQKKMQERAATKQYQEYLRLQMVKEAEDTAMVDRLRKQAEEEIWERKEADQRKQREAREYLMKEVDIGRQQQIKMKADAREAALHQDDSEVAKIQEQQQELDAIEAEKAALRKKATMDNMRGVRAQAALKERARAREEQEKFLSTKLMEKMEAEHAKKLASQAGVARPYRPIKQTQWYT